MEVGNPRPTSYSELLHTVNGIAQLPLLAN